MATVRSLKYFKTCNFCTDSKLAKKRIFSGIQPTGNVHLGNYLGAIRNWVTEQNDPAYSNTIFSIVDLHSITVPQKPDELRRNIKTIAATLLACGIESEKSILFQQSTVSQHTELAWILGTLATMPQLSRLPQYREKAANFRDIPFGLYVYPVLQAADVLLYKATHVPVGADQKHQIELVQHLARTFNRKFSDFFPIPKSMIQDDPSCRIKSLRNPNAKMAKSDPDSRSRIHVLDSPDEILNKIKKAVTDCTSELSFDPENRPGVSNLLTIHSHLINAPVDRILADFSRLDTGQYKLKLAEVVVEKLKPIKKKTEDLLNHEEYLMNVLEKGSEKAKDIAISNLLEIKRLVGFC